MSKLVYFLFFLFLISGIVLSGCSNNKIKFTYEEFRGFQEMANERCDDRGGELIHFGLIVNPISKEKHYESVCFKKDELHFYYDLIQ